MRSPGRNQNQFSNGAGAEVLSKRRFLPPIARRAESLGGGALLVIRL
jgi:hypothetical protein